ncbi:uncharacterized protein LOC113275731 [Papaver somniferum]|uniref:uncharacterized protein LOC113275731 n=1 Tax=Papaver somniferum TaxID=3469 RepID=UPI000E6FC552|nr:uncharacterized protein LOC113275731 [Papaver somniferum]
MMLNLRLNSSFILGILFILLAIRGSIAHTQQALEKKQMGIENGFSTNGRNVDQEFFDVPTAAVTSKSSKKLGGRKMLLDADNEKEMKTKHENAQLKDGEVKSAAKISGINGKNAPARLLGNPQEGIADQNNRSKLKPEKLTSTSWMKKLIKADADEELATLMQKDYPVNPGRDRPRRKPPINNGHNPLRTDHTRP